MVEGGVEGVKEGAVVASVAEAGGVGAGAVDVGGVEVDGVEAGGVVDTGGGGADCAAVFGATGARRPRILRHMNSESMTTTTRPMPMYTVMGSPAFTSGGSNDMVAEAARASFPVWSLTFT